jgi:AraC-like DNA-binding protein
LHGGEPLENSNIIFGDTIQFARHLCFVAGSHKIAVSGAVRNLATKDHKLKGEQYLCFSPQDEKLLLGLFDNLEKNWQDANFDIDFFSREMAMSKSQLYRKIISLTGLSPNILLKEYRLLKAKDLMKKQHHNIAQVTFDSGFTSASYFTKCFKQKFGILPMAYLELLRTN